MLNLDAERPFSAPLEAATLLVLRESPPSGALEVFFVRRHAASPFLGGAVVFPGGKLEAADGLVTRTNGVAPRALGARNLPTMQAMREPLPSARVENPSKREAFSRWFRGYRPTH